MKLVYVAGPYSRGEVAENVGIASRAGVEIIKAGHCPHVPHAHTHVMAIVGTCDYEEWMAIDFEMVRRSDAVFRLPGISDGAEREVALADDLGLPVFTVMDELLEWLLVNAENE